MAIDFIAIDLTSQREGPRELHKALQTMRSARECWARVREMMVHLQDGSDFSAIEARYGTAPGTGQALFTLFDGGSQVLDGTISGYINEALGRVGAD